MAKAVSNTSRTKTTSTTKTTKTGRTERGSSAASRTATRNSVKALRSPAPAKKAAAKPETKAGTPVVKKAAPKEAGKTSVGANTGKATPAAPVKAASVKSPAIKKAAVEKKPLAVPTKPVATKKRVPEKAAKPAPVKAAAAVKKAVPAKSATPEAHSAPAPQPAKPAPIKVSSILITQPRPDTEKSPYFDLARRFNLKMTFHPFVKIEGVTSREFRRQRVAIAEHTAVVLTSRNAVDHFFRIADETKTKVSQDMKYFCSTEAVALYLQKFILYRKRKVFFSADGSTKGLQDVITRHKQEKYMVVVTDGGKNEISQHLAKLGSTYSEVMLYRTVPNDIAPAMQEPFDMIVFFSPFSVQTLFAHDPKFKQNGTLIGAFGPTTSLAVEKAGLRLDVKAPAPATPSMVAALEQYLAAAGSKKK